MECYRGTRIVHSLLADRRGMQGWFFYSGNFPGGVVGYCCFPAEKVQSFGSFCLFWEAVEIAGSKERACVFLLVVRFDF